MIQKSARWMPSIVACATLAVLVGCGGDTDSLVATSGAQADASTVPWNTATTLAVVANDTVTNGTASVSVSSAPAHGTATVQGTSLVYTPTTGYFGSDTLAYTLTVGDKTSTATVQLAVAATLTLSGTVRDDALPGAQVVVTVGGVAQPAVTADASGNYAVSFTTATPTDFITLKATGAGTQSNVVLSSLVGDASVAATVASTTGAVTASALSATNVTNVSTAIAVLTAQALGTTPTSSADIASVQGQFTAAKTIEMATAIKLVADEGVALPSGATSTLDLVSNASTYTAFVTTQSTTNAALFTSTQAAVVADPAIAVAPTTPVAGGADVNIVLTVGQGAGANSVTALTLKADGTATIAGEPVQTATWTSDGSQITVTYDTPQTYPNNLIASDGYQYAATETDTAFILRQLGTGTATIDTVGSYVFSSGPDAGATITVPTAWQTETIVTGIKAFGASDMAIGTEWAGVLTTDFDPNTASYTNQDVLKIVDATHVLYERTNVTGTYVVADGALQVTTSAGDVFSYARLFTGPKGEDRWLTSKIVDGVSTWEFDAAVFKVTAGLAFTTASAVGDYQSYINVGLVNVSGFYIDLLADGTGGGSSSTGTSGLPSPLSTWAIGSDGSETLTSSNSTRTWTLLATSGQNIYVMERLTYPSSGYDQYRTNVYSKVD